MAVKYVGPIYVCSCGFLQGLPTIGQVYESLESGRCRIIPSFAITEPKKLGIYTVKFCGYLNGVLSKNSHFFGISIRARWLE